nr:hypothetical protein [Tanacetum cinerariifolium]
MTRSSTKELFTPLENPKRVFRSKRKLFETPGLVESSSAEFDLFFNIEERSEEEKTIEIKTETMKQYMSKTHENYGSGVSRPKIDDKTHFELKGKFLKELRENTFSGSELEDANEHIEKVLKIVDLFYIPEEVILFYNGLDVPTRQILDSKGAIPNKTAADAKVAIQEMAEYSRKWHNGTSLKTKSIETSDGLIGHMSKVLQDRGIKSLPSSTEPNPKDHVKSISIAKAHSTRIRRIGSGSYAVSNSQYSNLFSEIVSFPNRLHGYRCDDWMEAREVKILETCDYALPQKEKDPWSFTLPCFIHNVCFDKALVDLGASVSVMSFSTYSNLGLGDLAHTRRPFLSTAHAKIDVFKRKITIRVGEEKLVFKSIKPATSIIRRVYMLKEGMNLDSKFELIEKAVNESFDPHYGFSIIDDVDETSGVVLALPFCKKFVSCQKIIERFTHGNECEQMNDEE